MMADNGVRSLVTHVGDECALRPVGGLRLVARGFEALLAIPDRGDIGVAAEPPQETASRIGLVGFVMNGHGAR